MYPETWVFDGVERLLKCLLLTALFLTAFLRPLRAWLVSWVLFGWWVPLSVAVRWVSDSPITSSLMGMAMASSPSELLSLLRSLPNSWIVWFFVWNILGVGGAVALCSKPEWRWSVAVRRKIALVCVGLLLVPLFASEKSLSVSEASERTDIKAVSDPFATGDLPIGFDGDLPLAFPYELPWAFAQYWQAREVVVKARAALRSAPPEHALSVWSGSPDVVVLVVGESSSRSAWRLFNPDAPNTTPYLMRRANEEQGIYLFHDVVAQSTSTRQAVPSMLTPQPLIWPDGKPNPTATQSIVSLVGHAGYATAWLSNQSAVGKFDGVVAAYADEAATKVFLNPSSFFQQGSHDGVLLPILQRHLERSGKLFVVLHTMGSHFQFSHRYPEGFGLHPMPKNSRQTYQNSIAYTDQLLDQVIELLIRDGRSSVMVYASDHGQGLADEVCKKSDVNRVTADAYQVPALVWLSREYLNANPKAVMQLKNQSASPYTVADIYQTLHDLISGAFDKGDTHELGKAFGFLRESKAIDPQMVVAPDMRWVDFKTAAASNPCLIKAP